MSIADYSFEERLARAATLPSSWYTVYPDNYSTNLIVPLGPERTLTVFEWYFRDPDQSNVQEALKRTIEFSD
ncbi:MAG: hypothetical protein AABN33_01065 [Acidobacteriota bacterium]